MKFHSAFFRLLLLVNLSASAFIFLPVFSYAASNQSLRSWYTQSMSKQERMRLQIDLMFASNYDGVIDGDIGNRSINSIQRYQKKLGLAPSGVLSAFQLAKLRTDASVAFGKLDIQKHFDSRSGFSLFLPMAYLDEFLETAQGTRYFRASGGYKVETIRIDRPQQSLKQLFDRLVSEKGESVTYSTFHGEWFVITGTEYSRRFYTRFYTDGFDQRGFSTTYDMSFDQILSPVVVFMSNAFSPYTNTSPEPEQEAAQSLYTIPKSRPQDLDHQIEEEKSSSSGTGFFVSNHGFIATNAHVVKGCSVVEVDGWGQSEIIHVDEKNDLAVLRSSKANGKVHALKLNISGAKLGEDILALGYPLRGLLSEKSSDLSVTTGVVSTLAGLQGDRRYLTISAPVQPGNSGGPLVNRKGEVVGVVSAKLNAMKIMLLTGDVPQNVNFAVKSQLLAGHLLSAGLSQSDYLSLGAEKFNETSELVATLKSSVVAINCTQ